MFGMRLGLVGCVLSLWLMGCGHWPATWKQAAAPGEVAAEAEAWLLAGQSNMMGCGMFKEPIPGDPRIVMFDMDDRWKQAEEPVHRIYNSEHPAILKRYFRILLGDEQKLAENRLKLGKQPHDTIFAGVGMGLFFARELRQATGRPIALVPCAFGGTNMVDWSLEPTTATEPTMYSYMLERARKAREQGGAPRVKGVLWSQGEAEGGTTHTAERYAATMGLFIQRLRNDLGEPNLPFFIVQTGRFATAGSPQPAPLWEIVREQQRQLATQMPDVYLVSSLDVPLDDPIHVSQEGHAVLGRRLAEIALTEVYRRPGHGREVTLKSIELVDRATLKTPPCFDRPYQYRVRFDGVSGRLTARGAMTGFEIRTPGAGKNIPMFYRTEADPRHPDAVLLWVAQPGAELDPGLKLVYGSGINPYVNIQDEKGMAVPGFGPVELPTARRPVIEFQGAGQLDNSRSLEGNP